MIRAAAQFFGWGNPTNGTSGRSSAAKPGNRIPPDFDSELLALFECVRPYTMTSIERVASLCNAVEYIVRHDVPGAVVECGVWKGGSMMAAALTLKKLHANDRDLYLFDTFDGMPAPSEMDRDFRGRAADQLMEVSEKQSSTIWAWSPLEQTKSSVLSTGYPADRIHFVEGRVEETIPASAPQEIALLRLDTDWYESTRHELEHLYPRLVPGGVLIIDDYGHWDGARRAVDEYLSRNRLPLLLNRIDYTGRIAVKPR